MTRKIFLVIILILSILCVYEVVNGNNVKLREKVASVSELKSSSKELDKSIAVLEKNTSTEFEKKQQELSTKIDQYKKSRSEYENTLEIYSTDSKEVQLNERKDIYDVDFLWTIVGNYATEEGINLKFDVNKNTSSVSSLNNQSTDYIVCDLKFTITGNYINLTDFIYDLEDDDRLNFEINNFEMSKPSVQSKSDDESTSDASNQLQVTLNVQEVKINLLNLIDNASLFNSGTQSSSQQMIDSSSTTRENPVVNEVN